jgi:hypothetical protein
MGVFERCVDASIQRILVPVGALSIIIKTSQIRIDERNGRMMMGQTTNVSVDLRCIVCTTYRTYRKGVLAGTSSSLSSVIGKSCEAPTRMLGSLLEPAWDILRTDI